MSQAEEATRVVKIKRKKDGTIMQGCDVYIGRRMTMGGWNLPQSKWMNPFTVKKCGSNAKAVHQYEEYLLNRPELLKDIEELRGKILGCWCKVSPSVPCHGDVLIKLLKNKTQKQRESQQEKEKEKEEKEKQDPEQECKEQHPQTQQGQEEAPATTSTKKKRKRSK